MSAAEATSVMQPEKQSKWPLIRLCEVILSIEKEMRFHAVLKTSMLVFFVVELDGIYPQVHKAFSLENQHRHPSSSLQLSAFKVFISDLEVE